MDISKFKTQWKAITSEMNKRGLPLPTIRDPKTGLGSISLTLVFISFNIVLVGLVGKWAGALGGIDLTQALNLFYACAALYWGRKLGDVTPKESSPQPDLPASKAKQPVDNPD